MLQSHLVSVLTRLNLFSAHAALVAQRNLSRGVRLRVHASKDRSISRMAALIFGSEKK